MPRILKLQKVDVPVGRNYRPRKKKSWTKCLILGLSIENRIRFQSDFIFLKVYCLGNPYVQQIFQKLKLFQIE